MQWCEAPANMTSFCLHVLHLQENPDLFKWLTGQQEAPSQLQANAAFTALKQHVGQQLSDSCHTASQAAPGKEWLRGWDDSWRYAATHKLGCVINDDDMLHTKANTQ